MKYLITSHNKFLSCISCDAEGLFPVQIVEKIKAQHDPEFSDALIFLMLDGELITNYNDRIISPSGSDILLVAHIERSIPQSDNASQQDPLKIAQDSSLVESDAQQVSETNYCAKFIRITEHDPTIIESLMLEVAAQNEYIPKILQNAADDFVSLMSYGLILNNKAFESVCANTTLKTLLKYYLESNHK